MDLNNREWAALFWLLAALAWALSRRTIRSSLRDVVRHFLHPKILLPIVAMVAYVGALVRVGWQFRLWSPNVIKETIIWFFASGFILLMNLDRASREQGFFRRAALRTLEVTVFIEFFMNLFVLSLPAELILQPIIALLVLLSLVAAREEQYRTVRRLVDVLLAIIGLSLAAFALVQLFRQWDQLDATARLLEFALPVWLTLGLLPFIYALSVWAAYELAFIRIDWAARDRPSRWRAKLALITVLHGRTRELSAFAGYWPQQAASAGSFTGARSVIRKFRSSRKQQEAAITEEKTRRERYAGVVGTDAEGRQLDRREFEETTRALRWLSTCQMGWYGNRGGKYRADMLEILGNDFRSHGLPSEHGITMHVAEDGDSWWAWRRTITGWCFAIGAAAPPPDQWEFDGPDPPGEFPGEDERWGDGPFSLGSNQNW